VKDEVRRGARGGDQAAFFCKNGHHLKWFDEERLQNKQTSPSQKHVHETRHDNNASFLPFIIQKQIQPPDRRTASLPFAQQPLFPPFPVYFRHGGARAG
jgi:hypothetical protein